MKIWMLFYTHKHGHDHFFYTTEEVCKQHALHLVREYRESFDVDANISDKDALLQWPELTDGSENIEWGEYSVEEKF